MNHSISILFRAIPLAMALYCFSYGAFVFFEGNTSNSMTAGLVVFFLGSICIALFSTAATIIRQLIGKFNTFDKWFYPLLGYTLAATTSGLGLWMIFYGSELLFVPGHVVTGLGFIGACVSTVAAASTKFILIPKSSARNDNSLTEDAFSTHYSIRLQLVPVILAGITWIWAFYLLSHSDIASHYVAGSVLAGIAMVCISLIALVSSIVRQESNQYTKTEKTAWPRLVLSMGTLSTIWGIVVLWLRVGSPTIIVGWVLIGLGLICFSISSKVILLSKIWKGSYALSNRIPIIPVVTALLALFISCFLFEWTSFDSTYYVPARVLSGFGALCFTLFSIVSILESGTSKK